MGIQYSFTNDAGWRITEYRPFSLSYAVRQTPYMMARYREPAGKMAVSEADTQPTGDGGRGVVAQDILKTFTESQLKFDYLSWDVIRQMIEERVQIRDKHRKDILGRVSDLSGEIYCCHIAMRPDSVRQKSALEKTKLDLEKQAREEDLALWKDVTDLRKELLLTQRKYQSTRMRTDLVSGTADHDAAQTDQHRMGPGHVPGPQADDRQAG